MNESIPFTTYPQMSAMSDMKLLGEAQLQKIGVASYDDLYAYSKAN